MDRWSDYRVMWILVFFDVPTETKEDKQAYQLFRKLLRYDGFSMFQFSVYVRHCASMDNAEVHIKRVKGFVPSKGRVAVMCITDKQFANIQLLQAPKREKPRHSPSNSNCSDAFFNFYQSIKTPECQLYAGIQVLFT